MASNEQWPVGTEVIVRGDHETYRGRVVRGCCSEHVFVERPKLGVERRLELVARLTRAPAEPEADEASKQRDELLGAIERYEAAMKQPLSAGPARTRIWRKALYDTAKRIRERSTGA